MCKNTPFTANAIVLSTKDETAEPAEKPNVGSPGSSQMASTLTDATSVVIPAFNEAAAIGDVVTGLRGATAWHEILVIDDGSSDGTGDRAAAAGARVIRHPYNKGNGAAVKTGLRQATGRYVLIIGERRCRASKLAGRETIPAIIRRVSDQQAAEMTVIENLQRQDLNCLEQAAAFGKLSQQFGLTQQQIGERVGLSRESVSNYMRLLKLPISVIEYLKEGVLGFSEARELLKLDNDKTIERIAEEAFQKNWNLAGIMDAVEAETRHQYEHLPETVPGRARWVDPNVRAAARELERILGVRVRIRDKKGKGKIVLEYATLEDFDRVMEMLTGPRK